MLCGYGITGNEEGTNCSRKPEHRRISVFITFPFKGGTGGGGMEGTGASLFAADGCWACSRVNNVLYSG